MLSRFDFISGFAQQAYHSEFYRPFPLIFHTSCALEVRHITESATIVMIFFIVFRLLKVVVSCYCSEYKICYGDSYCDHQQMLDIFDPISCLLA